MFYLCLGLSWSILDRFEKFLGLKWFEFNQAHDHAFKYSNLSVQTDENGQNRPNSPVVSTAYLIILLGTVKN